MGQITRTWKKDGTARFDTLKEMRDRYRTELSDLNWDNVKSRPDLQMRAVILHTKRDYDLLSAVTDPWERLAFVDAAYNGGYGGMQNERRACRLAAGCDEQKWFDNVERYCLKSKVPTHNGRSSCDVNRHHVRDVLKTRYTKYDRWFDQN